MAQSASERNWPALRTPTLHGPPVLRTVCFVPGKRKPAVTFSPNSTGLIPGGGGYQFPTVISMIIIINLYLYTKSYHSTWFLGIVFKIRLKYSKELFDYKNLHY